MVVLFTELAAKITVHTVKCTVTHRNFSSATMNYSSVTMNYPSAVFSVYRNLLWNNPSEGVHLRTPYF